MVILLTGASGFIGRHLSLALSAAGHEVIQAMRRPAENAAEKTRMIQADFTQDFSKEVWLPRLKGVDAVINAVGIIREQGRQTFDAIHSRAPRALFEACAESGVQRIVQISALGADDQAQSQYHLSKKQADDFLTALPVHSFIVQPSLVYGKDGTSARLFNLLASLPVVPLPGKGNQQVQPVHIDDVVAAVIALLEPHASANINSGQRIVLAGPQALTLSDFLERLRHAMQLGRAHVFPVPSAFMRAGAALGRWLPGSLLDPETLQMLERGNTASVEDMDRMRQLLGHAPRSVDQFIDSFDAPAARLLAQSEWLFAVLRFSIALVWIVTGIVSFGLYPVEESYALLARVGITGWLAPVMLYGAALLDLCFGIAILIFKRRYWLWLAQLSVILFYTFIISWKLPEFWLHPYGPLLKNLPMLAAIWLLFEWEKRS